MPKIGQKIRFTPAAWLGEAPAGDTRRKKVQTPREVTGEIKYINPAHRCYLVEYEIHGYTQRETFKY